MLSLEDKPIHVGHNSDKKMGKIPEEEQDELRKTFDQQQKEARQLNSQNNQSAISYPTPSQDAKKKANLTNEDEYSAQDEFYDGEIQTSNEVKRSNLSIESMTMNNSTPLQTNNTQGMEAVTSKAGKGKNAGAKEANQSNDYSPQGQDKEYDEEYYDEEDESQRKS